jgi:DNA repair protein RecN (Recombination protein N)
LAGSWAGAPEARMLSSLRLKNIATISDTTLELDGGLNVLTGETGAGKSILVDGLLLALGERADYSLVRPGSKTASVEAVFRLEAGEEIQVRREISSAGRSRLLVDDEVLSLEEARSRIGDLVDLHTQRSSPALLSRRFQQSCLDSFAGGAQEASALRDDFRRLQDADERARLLELDLGTGATGHEMLLHEQALMSELSPSRDEYTDLLEKRRVLERSDALSTLYGRALAALSGDEGGMLSAISALKGFLEKSGEDAGDIPDLLDSADIALREASSRCASRLAAVEGAPWMMEQIDARLDTYGRVLGRYGGDIDRLLSRAAEISTELERRSLMERDLADLSTKRAELASRLEHRATGLSALRRKSLPGIEKAVRTELRKLGMPDAVFTVAFSGAPKERSVESCGRLICSDGAELPEFLFSANPGLPPGPISSVASGGELSRLSLSVRLALSGPGSASTLVFDEIDSGVGGETAGLLASSLSRASRNRQTIVITHLPQIASRALRHLAVSKSSGPGMPETSVRVLEGDARAEEIARMLGGGAAAMDHARAMLAEAGGRK